MPVFAGSWGVTDGSYAAAPARWSFTTCPYMNLAMGPASGPTRGEDDQVSSGPGALATIRLSAS